MIVREPVTVMTPISSPAASVSGSCAQAELVANDAETPIARQWTRARLSVKS